MSTPDRLCQATTKAGAPCKNSPRAGSDYCYIHRNFEQPTAAPPVTAAAAINELAQEIQQDAPSYQPPPFSPQALLAMVQETFQRVTGDIHLPIVEELMNNLKGTKPEDLVDPETWKGLWYILNYTAQAESKQALEQLEQRIAALPGGQTVLDLKSNLQGTSPADLLDVNTWKGAWVVLNAAVRAQAEELQKNLMSKGKE
jgi:hypothetical protein